MNIISFYFISVSVIIVALYFFINKLPAFYVIFLHFGRTLEVDRKSGFTGGMQLEVPRSWFKYFYRVGLTFYCVIFLQVNAAYIYRFQPSDSLLYLLDVTCGINREANVPAMKVYIGMIIMCVQVFRRFYEVDFVSVYSKNSKCNVALCSLGYFFYIFNGLALLCQAPKFSKSTRNVSSTLNWKDLSILDFLAIITFMWACWHQFITIRILAKLRKDKKDNVVTEDRKIPQGDWFKYLSSPHQTAEIIMYFAMTVLLWPNPTWLSVFIFVLVNQSISILLNHEWYERTFTDFPKTRKALIPFIF